MRLIRDIDITHSFLRQLISSGKSIGFVPTMGALHQGHMSLIEQAKKDNDIVVVSVFVNPKQFLRGEDFDKYPHDIIKDKKKASAAGCDILFYPDKDLLYPKDFSTYVDVGELSGFMCGVSRPGHFKAVATICLKLFNIIMPARAYFGQKDYQQALIIRRMVKDLDMGLDIKVLPIIREPSGLAMSSRNNYLNSMQRRKAGLIYRSLMSAQEKILSGEKSVSKIACDMRKILAVPGLSIDYISIADPFSLRPLKKINNKALIAVAVKVGKTRLIDNILVEF
jgi:pantoate--beta-alanine ligase